MFPAVSFASLAPMESPCFQRQAFIEAHDSFNKNKRERVVFFLLGIYVQAVHTRTNFKTVCPRK